MTRPSSILLAALTVTTLSCGETTTNAPSQLNLDRPTDMTFACHGALRLTNGQPPTVDQQVTISAQPTFSCDVRSRPLVDDVQQRPPGQEDIAPMENPVGAVFWYGFILQRGPGTVAIANFQTKPATAFAGADVVVLDADPLTPGKNGISVGEDPVAIATDSAGCKVVTANAGSCDLSILDINSALDTTEPVVDVQRLAVTNPDLSPIASKPAAMAFQPSIETVGNACPATATGIAYIAYPSCHLVAAVDVATGTMVSGIQYDALGVPQIVTGNVACPDECGGGGIATPGTRPITLDLEYDPRVNTRRLSIGADNSSSLAIVELDPVTTLPLSVRQIALEETIPNLGVTQVAMSQQIGMGGSSGFINDTTAAGGQRQFVYAITTDDTIHVVDVLNDVECDTQVDPREIVRGDDSIRTLSCMPVGDPATPPRRPGAKGPGIELTNNAIPTSVDIIRSEAIPNDSRLAATPDKLVGYFAVISATNGGVFVANVDDDDFPDLYTPADPLAVQVPLAIAHQLRDAVGDRGLVAETPDTGIRECENFGPLDSQGVAGAGPRANNPPARNLLSNAIAVEKSTQLPGIRQDLCAGDVDRAIAELNYMETEETRALVFPDLRALRGDENWTITWEGSLSLDRVESAVDGPVIRESQMSVDFRSLHLVDDERPYCDAGVEPFDIVQMRGCDPGKGNIDCPLGYRCFVHPQSQVQGIGACMLDSEADRLADACQKYLTSVRRYTVSESKAGELVLLPRRHTLRTTPIDGCTDDTQCKMLADYAMTLSRAEHPSASTAEPDPFEYKCLADPLRSPVATGKRCAMVCQEDADCTTGTVCEEGVCMEGVLPPQACINAPQRYELRAGEAFAVIGSRSGYVHPLVADATDRCVKDPTEHRLTVGRFPLDPPPCDPAADPLTGALPAGGFEPNPCLATVKHTEQLPLYTPGTCSLGSPSSALVERDAQAIRFRNRGMTFHVVDPTYPGDQMCITDRKGPGGVPLVGVPHVYGGYNLTFRIVAGFQPLGVPVSPSFPVKVVRGPTQSIWVIDEGDFLSTSIAQPSTRGKVFRIEPHSLGLINVLE